jgi:hypothetical protein
LNRKVLIADPFFNEYVYHCIVSSSAELRNKLPTSLLQHTHTQEKIKRFADKASLEQKIEMLSRLGVSFAMFFSTPEYLMKEELVQAYKNHKSDKNYNTVNDMIQKRQFVFTSRDVMAVLGIMGQNCHSNTYMINRDYSRIATEIQNFQTDKKVKDVDIIKSVMQDNRMVAKLLMHNLMNQSYVDIMTNYKPVDLLVLFFLFLRMDKNTTSYTPLKKVQEHFRSIYNSRTISTTLSGLYKSGHVQRFPTRLEYAISGLGVQTLFAYITRLVNNALTR